MIGTKPYAAVKHRDVLGRQMAYIDEGEGDAIVFAHGNPASSYVWRNVMPHLEGLGRLVAADMIGMGESDKLEWSGPGSYHYHQQREYLFALWDSLDLGDRTVLVGHDWGAVLGIDWARQHPGRVQGIAHMESIGPMRWCEFPEQGRLLFEAFRSPVGERMILQDNMFIEVRLPGAVLRKLTDEEMDHYRRPYLRAGEDRRPTLSWPRELPIDGEPHDVVDVVKDNAEWMATSDVPKLFINLDPGAIARGRTRDAIRGWPNQKEVTVKGMHTAQEDSPDEIGMALAGFIRRLRPPGLPSMETAKEQ